MKKLIQTAGEFCGLIGAIIIAACGLVGAVALAVVGFLLSMAVPLAALAIGYAALKYTGVL